MSQGQQKLYTAIVTKLRLDTGAGSLVALTGHTATDLRIARDKPPKKGITPFLGVSIFFTVPLIEDGPTQVRESSVHFRSYAGKELTALQIADRMEELLHDITDNTGYYSFSDANVSTRQVRFKSRTAPDFDDDVEVCTITIVASIIWVDAPCP